MVPAMQQNAKGSVDIGVSRRAALHTLAAGIGATVAAPALAADTTDHTHAAQAQRATAARRQGPAPHKPVTFDAHQFATVVVLSELIVPGAKASGTPEFLDKWLEVESAETKRRFFTALGAFEGAALKAHGKAFKDLTAAQQTEILKTASTMEPSRTPVYWKKGDPIPVPEPPARPANLRDHFDHIKGLVAGVYFTSEPGLKALGSTGTLFHQSFPGCTA